MQHKVPFLLMLLTLSMRISIANADECTGNGGSKFAYPIVVDKSGGGNFTSVQSAIDSIPQENHQWVKVQINPGVYMEKVTIPKQKPCIFPEGQDRSVTTITFDAHNRTDESATFTSMADNIVAKGITFKNSYNHPLLLKHALSERKVLGVLQAVAARILGDKSAFFECGFLGLQDTLWDASGRHYFAKCHIEGAADFIFGSGQSIYQACEINVTAGALSSQYPYGYITAQDDPSGFVFKEGTLFGNVRSYLGRAYGPYSRVIFQETTMNADVVPQGWDAWKFPGKEENITYAEVNCKGPGSDTSNRVTWEKKLTPSQLQQFSLSYFIDQDGWISNLPME
ncbi:hypothetical protein J1N35_044301 [Gossypium stocksii]|uniref:pectinesterase n=1 Tax=Gossypium stocksii TaxID=47602 RepID=A0A9D3U904_9ROSI|nr:hypothetical protein J1N35_044301 [Gossypium stocksii]